MQSTEGAIGYVEYAYVLRKRLAHGLVQNAAGTFVAPGPDSFEAAAVAMDWSDGEAFDQLVTDAPGVAAYPVLATSFALVPRHRPGAARKAVLAFFDYALGDGQHMTASLGYQPMPPALLARIAAYRSALD